MGHPEHWDSYTGPANWYRVWHPPTWTLEESESGARLTSADGEGTLTLSCFWLPEDRREALGESLDLKRLFSTYRRVRNLRPLELPYRSLGFEGEARLAPPLPWWKRILARSDWKRWRVWAVQQKTVCLVAAFFPGDKADRETETVAGMILNTLAFADDPADPPRVFSDRVLQLAREKFPLLKCEQGEDFRLQIGESSVNLFNFYRSYVNDPTRFEEIVLTALTTVVQVQEWGKDQTEPPLHEVRDRIMPMLYPEAVWRESFPNFVGVPWVAGLMILYVVDESQAYWYIREDLLKTWDLSVDELHELALANVDAYFARDGMELTVAGEDDGPKLLMPTKADAYNTSRMLSPVFHARLQDVLGREFAVGVPGRDFFVAFSLDFGEALAQIRRKVVEDHAQMDHPLTDRILLVSADGVSEYCE
jgi:hypothetical protein